MKSLFQSVLLYLAVGSDSEVANQIQYLKIENEILRSKLPKRIAVTRGERNRLLKYGIRPTNTGLRMNEGTEEQELG